MTRHPSTEGNELRPKRVDAIKDVTVPNPSGPGRISVSELTDIEASIPVSMSVESPESNYVDYTDRFDDVLSVDDDTAEETITVEPDSDEVVYSVQTDATHGASSDQGYDTEVRIEVRDDEDGTVLFEDSDSESGSASFSDDDVGAKISGTGTFEETGPLEIYVFIRAEGTDDATRTPDGELEYVELFHTGAHRHTYIYEEDL